MKTTQIWSQRHVSHCFAGLRAPLRRVSASFTSSVASTITPSNASEPDAMASNSSRVSSLTLRVVISTVECDWDRSGTTFASNVRNNVTCWLLQVRSPRAASTACGIKSRTCEAICPLMREIWRGLSAIVSVGLLRTSVVITRCLYVTYTRHVVLRAGGIFSLHAGSSKGRVGHLAETSRFRFGLPMANYGEHEWLYTQLT